MSLYKIYIKLRCIIFMVRFFKTTAPTVVNTTSIIAIASHITLNFVSKYYANWVILRRKFLK